MLTLREFLQLAKITGAPMTWTQAKEPKLSVTLAKAILQSTKKERDTIVNSYGLNGHSIQVAKRDLPVAPEKFDRFTDNEGNHYVADTVVTHKERGTGLVTHYTIYCKGKG